MDKEYIEREALLADLAKRYCEPCEAEGKDHNHVRCRACWVEDMMGEIGDAPFAADVVEVVRCRECVHCMLWQRPTNKVIGDCRIRKMNCYDDQFCMVGADDFCSYGERRDNNAAD